MPMIADTCVQNSPNCVGKFPCVLAFPMNLDCSRRGGCRHLFFARMLKRRDTTGRTWRRVLPELWPDTAADN
jgi:hypothetical protein